MQNDSVQWLTLPDIADRLECDVAAVRGMVAERLIVGVRRNGIMVVPADFLVPGHLVNPAVVGDPSSAPTWAVLASLQGTLTVLADVGFDNEAAIEWLFTSDDQLGTTPLEALRAGRKTEVRRRAALEL